MCGSHERTSIDLKAMIGAYLNGWECITATDTRDRRGSAPSIRPSSHLSEAELRPGIAALPDGVCEAAAHLEHDAASGRICTIRASVHTPLLFSTE